MNDKNNNTLVNPQNGNLAFKIQTFESSGYLGRIQRLGFYSMILIEKGEGNLHLDLLGYKFSENTLMCFTPYQPFMVEASEPLTGVCIHFHPDFFCIHKHQKETGCNGVLFNNIYDPPLIQTNCRETIQLLALIDTMQSEIQNQNLDQYDLIVSYLKIFLITASRIKIEKHPKARLDFSDKEHPFILQNLKDAIETHYKIKHMPSEYAGMLNISPKALTRICKNYFNKTLTDLIAERILIEAKRELYLTSKSIKEIAWELGYEDEHYFSRFFKKNAEISPQLYRETMGYARAEQQARS